MLRVVLPLIMFSAAAGAATVVTEMPSPGVDCDWQRVRWKLGSAPVSTAAVTNPKGGLAAAEEEAAERQRWRLGLHYFQGTKSSLGAVLSGQWDTVPQNGIRLTAGVVMVEDLWDWPLDLIAEGGLMWHNEKGVQPDVFQYTLALKVEWKRFPWSEHLRTRAGAGTGLSYVDHIPIAEKANRNSPYSKHLLQYLEFWLAFNCGDISRLTCLDRLFPNSDASFLDGAWIIASTPHRSGVGGLYGRDKNGRRVLGGSNYLSIGIELEF